MEKASELFILNKYKYGTSHGGSREEQAKTKEELKKEKALAKELKKKKMEEACKPKATATQIVKKVTYEDHTVPGEKKDLSQPMPETYDPKYVESSWEAWWQKKNFFKVDVKEALSKPKDQRFIMLLPPPNVTGSLHLGHTLMGTIEDAICRYKKLKGYVTLWVPGTDHAGIATQSVVEKKLFKDTGKYRKDFSRQEFMDKVWEWKKQYGDRIMEQFRRLGVSFDLSRYFFTMDDQRSESVKEAFIQLYEKGKLYRAKRIVNWCCALQTAIADVETEDFEIDKPTMLSIPLHEGKYEFGVLIDFAYRLKEDPTKEIVVSTTRIETMLGDSAVAVHPNDDRYKALIGKELIHPFFPNRSMKVIADDILVDPTFGTGAVKITPNHDPNDSLCGQRHNLDFINIFNDDGTLNENGGEFQGMRRYDCRNKIQIRLKEMGLLKGKKPNKMNLQRCSKTGDIIEPLVKAQWWVDCKEVAKRAMDDVNSGKLKILPEFQKATLFGFLEDIRDWCVSRQLWWGHQCPIYLVTIPGILDTPDNSNNDHWVAAKSEEEAKEKASKKFNCADLSKIKVVQDEEVLDTWFSSALLPFSCFGWPNVNGDELKAFFPTDLLETGHDIIFFWVARMVFMSYFFMDTVPFHTVFLHPIVKDAQGRKMSKSLGNVLDPIDVIDGTKLELLLKAIKEGNLPASEIEKSLAEKRKEFPDGIPECGADALRLGLMSYLVQGRNINLDISRVVSYRFFGNKLWNAIKFLKIYTSKDFTFAPIDNSKLTFIDKWILNKLSRTIQTFDKNFQDYFFGEATNTIYSFWYYNICDVYIEALKCILSDNSPYDKETKNNTKNVFLFCVENALILLSPLTPFIAEELFQRLPARTNAQCDTIFNAKFPTELSYINEDIDKQGETILAITHSVKSVLSQFQILNSKPKICLYSTDKDISEIVNKEKHVMATLCKGSQISTVSDKNDKSIAGWLANVINANMDVYLDIGKLIDMGKEIKRLGSTLEEKKKYESGIRNKMEKKEYTTKVPENIRKEDKEKLDMVVIEITKIEESIASLNKMQQ